MPVLGTSPTLMGQSVIMTNGTKYVRAILTAIEPQRATLQTSTNCPLGPYRIFPLFPETDGLYELQGTITSQEGDTVWLHL
jgi:hypothetical protein